MDFIDASPSSFHAVQTISSLLEKEGYTELKESEKWNPEEGKGYFVCRNGGSLIAFRYQKDYTGFSISAAHSDYPCFKIKDKGELTGEFVRLNTERYGGMICSTWLDRPLSVAGRVLVETDRGMEMRLLNIDRGSVAHSLGGYPHEPQCQRRHEIQSGGRHRPAFRRQRIQRPVFKSGCPRTGCGGGENFRAGPLCLCTAKGLHLGLNQEYISSRALDDLQCAFSTLKGFLAAKAGKSLPVCAVFDNEEVGSGTRQGAASTFLYDVLRRICPAEEDYLQALASSFLLSCDNAHAVHPNHPEYAHPENRVVLNGGVVLKFNAGQKYTTDGISEAYVKYLCKKEGIPVQSYANRSDMGGGSTLGNIATTRVSVSSADVGLPQLAMHSAYESAGIKDTAYMIELCRALFEGSFRMVCGGYELT